MLFIIAVDLEGRATLSIVPDGLEWQGKGAGTLTVERGVHNVPPARDGSPSGDVLEEAVIPIGSLTGITEGHGDPVLD